MLQKKTSISVLGSGLIYRNLKPHLRSEHAYFPSVVVMANGEMLALLVLAQAFESVDMHTYVARSTDDGESWRLEKPIYPGTTNRLTSDSCRVTALPDGEVVAFMVRADRTDHPDEGLANPANLGFVPTELLIFRSIDYGRTWTQPEAIIPPLVGPSFELCCPITPLQDGRWILPTSTWRNWEGEAPNGMRMVALVSHDRGKTWPEYMSVMGEAQSPIIYWESKIVEFPDGRLLATAWAYDEAAAKDLPNQYAISTDGGQTWSAPVDTGLLGQTGTPFVLGDDRIIYVYRRIDQPGLWANVVRLEGEQWINETETPIWGAGIDGLTSTSEDMYRNFTVLRFGAPCISQLLNGDLFVAFWCVEDCVSNIRWYKLRVET